MNETAGGPGKETPARAERVPREGSHGVQWGLIAVLVLIVVGTGAVAWWLGSSNQLGGTSWVLVDMPQSGIETGAYAITASFTGLYHSTWMPASA